MLATSTRARSRRFNNPVNLKRLVGLIDETEWTELGVDVKARPTRAAGEGRQRGQERRGPILHAACADPVDRPLHEARPAQGARLHDLRSGLRHGRLPVSAYEWLAAESKGGALDRDVAKRVKRTTYHGQELVPRPRRMALMNLYLHGIEPPFVWEIPSTSRRQATAST